MWQNRPVIQDQAEWFYAAFQLLSSGRPIGFGGAMPIALPDLEAYCRLSGLPAAEHLETVRILRSIDLEFLELIERRKSTKVAQPKQEA